MTAETRRFWKNVLRLGVPITLQNLLVNSFSLVDTVMVSQLGDEALSATGMAAQWANLYLFIIFGLCSGLATFVAQFWGADDRRGIRRVTMIAALFGLLASLFFVLPGLLIPESIIRLFNRAPGVVSAGAAYLRIAAWSYPGLLLFNVLSSVLRSTESVMLPLIASGISTVGNVFFNYGLIFGAFGMPAMGIRGAAVATVISTWLGPLMLLLVAALRRHLLFSSLQDYAGLSSGEVGRFFRRAGPVVINEALWGLGGFLFSLIFSNLGYEYAAAVTIYKSVDSLMFSLLVGFGSASSILVGKAIGSGLVAEGYRAAKRFVALQPAVTLVISVITIACRIPLISLFNLTGNLSELTVSTAMTILLIYAVELPVRNYTYLFFIGIFRPGGDTKNAAVFDLAFQWLTALPATFLAAYVFHFPFPAVFVTMLVMEDFFKIPACFIYFFSKKWIRPVTPQGQAGAEAFFAEIREKRSACKRKN